MTKFNLNPNYKKKRNLSIFRNLLKPVYLSVILIIIFFIISLYYGNIVQSKINNIALKHSKISSNPLYHQAVYNIDINKINHFSNEITKQIYSYKLYNVHQNVVKILENLGSSYSKYLPTGFILHLFNYEVTSDGATSTSLEIYYLKDYLDEVKTFSSSIDKYIKKIILKDFDNNG